MKIKTLIIDDDPHWQLLIRKLVESTPFLECIGVFGSAMDAYAQLHEADLLICDIELPDMKGVEFIQNLRQPPLVIFITSHANYALDCFEVAPVDFLLKGFTPQRFLKSIERVRERFKDERSIPVMEPYFFVRDGMNYAQIRYREVLYMKSQDNTLHIVTPDRVYSPTLTIPKMEEQLKGDIFIRVHRSYLVNRLAIVSITKDDLILTNGERVSIGEQYRAMLYRKHIEKNIVSRNG